MISSRRSKILRQLVLYFFLHIYILNLFTLWNNYGTHYSLNFSEVVFTKPVPISGKLKD